MSAQGLVTQKNILQAQLAGRAVQCTKCCASKRSVQNPLSCVRRRSEPWKCAFLQCIAWADDSTDETQIASALQLCFELPSEVAPGLEHCCS